MDARIMTFNIRYDNPYDGANCWKRRRDFVFEMLNAQSPDILCLQEVLPHVKQDLEESLPAYNFCGCGRSKELQDEYNPIGYRRERFDLLFTQTFWLGCEPQTPGSMNPYSVDLPRICTQVILRDKKEGIIFSVYNTHLDHMSVQARIWGMAVIFAQMQKYKDLPSLVTGDFNASPDGEELTYFNTYNPLSLVDFSDTSSFPITYTYHDFTDPKSNCKIDYIFATSDIEKVDYKTIRDTRDDLELSDHYPGICNFILAKASFNS